MFTTLLLALPGAHAGDVWLVADQDNVHVEIPAEWVDDNELKPHVDAVQKRREGSSKTVTLDGQSVRLEHRKTHKPVERDLGLTVGAFTMNVNLSDASAVTASTLSAGVGTLQLDLSGDNAFQSVMRARPRTVLFEARGDDSIKLVIR